jgi:cytoplasmic iron level regulating protein YaaA (DUF328/UPF0246 family)
MLAALAALLDGDRAAAIRALLLPPGVAEEALATNATAATGPTTPALSRYAGTVYDGLAFASLPEPERRLAGRGVYVFSGLLGVVRGAYRVPAKSVLPGVGVAGTSWRPVLDEAMPAMLGRGVVVDLRSSDYQAMWRPSGELARRTVTVRVLSPLPAGGLGVVSYPSKYAKGRLAAAAFSAVASGEQITGIEDLARIWRRSTGHQAEVRDATTLVVHHPAKIVGQPTGL